eukprot:1158515-Pelagomonas_calceolata.AAC.9
MAKHLIGHLVFCLMLLNVRQKKGRVSHLRKQMKKPCEQDVNRYKDSLHFPEHLLAVKTSMA